MVMRDDGSIQRERERERERANSRDQKWWVIAKWWICENCGTMMGDDHCLDESLRPLSNGHH